MIKQSAFMYTTVEQVDDTLIFTSSDIAVVHLSLLEFGYSITNTGGNYCNFSFNFKESQSTFTICLQQYEVAELYIFINSILNEYKSKRGFNVE